MKKASSSTNELQGQPTPLRPIALGPSERNGFDVEARVRLWKDGPREFSFFGNFSALTGELVNRPTGTHLPDVADFFGTYGFDLAMTLPAKTSPHLVTLSAMQLWEGPKPLNTTNSLSTKTSSRVDVRLSYTNAKWHGASTFLSMIIYPDRVTKRPPFSLETRSASHRKRPSPSREAFSFRSKLRGESGNCRRPSLTTHYSRVPVWPARRLALTGRG